MTTHPVPKSLLRMIPVLMVVLAVGGIQTAAAQQAADHSLRTTTPALVQAPAQPLLGPRLQPAFERVALPDLTERAGGLLSPAVQGGGRHTIVLSTLSLVLIGVLLILLI